MAGQQYNLNFPNLSEKTNVPRLRTPLHYAWLKVLTKPLQTLRDQFFGLNGYADGIIEKTKYNGQTIVLEAVLNKKVGSGTGIYIVNNNNILTEVYLRNSAEGYRKPFLSNGNGAAAYDSLTAYIMGNVVTYDGKYYSCILGSTGNSPFDTTYWKQILPYLHNEAEYSPAYDFTVYVPSAYYSANLVLITSLIEQYKISGVNYNIISY